MGISDYKINELRGLREVFFGGYEGGPNSKVISESMAQLGYYSLDHYFQDYKAGKLPIKSMIDAIAKVDSKGLAENFEQVHLRTK